MCFCLFFYRSFRLSFRPSVCLSVCWFVRLASLLDLSIYTWARPILDLTSVLPYLHSDLSVLLLQFFFFYIFLFIPQISVTFNQPVHLPQLPQPRVHQWKVTPSSVLYLQGDIPFCCHKTENTRSESCSCITLITVKLDDRSLKSKCIHVCKNSVKRFWRYLNITKY